LSSSRAASFRGTATWAAVPAGVISGQITENRSSCATPILQKADDIACEAGGISHYWVNKGEVAAVLLSSDVERCN
jgi:hypothetical protein